MSLSVFAALDLPCLSFALVLTNVIVDLGPWIGRLFSSNLHNLYFTLPVPHVGSDLKLLIRTFFMMAPLVNGHSNVGLIQSSQCPLRSLCSGWLLNPATFHGRRQLYPDSGVFQN